MRKIVIASRNRGKISEFRVLLQGLSVDVLSLSDFPDLPDIPETGKTFRENALLKAQFVTAATGLIALADDSGLEVDYLQGAPGVYSARFAGPNSDDQANNKKLLASLEGVPCNDRTARFRCVVAITTPQGGEFISEGTCEGMIARSPRGNSGFGYDPLFLAPSLGKTFAELGPSGKNRISHRARALHTAREILALLLKNEEGSTGCESES